MNHVKTEHGGSPYSVAAVHHTAPEDVLLDALKRLLIIAFVPAPTTVKQDMLEPREVKSQKSQPTPTQNAREDVAGSTVHQPTWNPGDADIAKARLSSREDETWQIFRQRYLTQKASDALGQLQRYYKLYGMRGAEEWGRFQQYCELLESSDDDQHGGVWERLRMSFRYFAPGHGLSTPLHSHRLATVQDGFYMLRTLTGTVRMNELETLVFLISHDTLCAKTGTTDVDKLIVSLSGLLENQALKKQQFHPQPVECEATRTDHEMHDDQRGSDDGEATDSGPGDRRDGSFWNKLPLCLPVA